MGSPVLAPRVMGKAIAQEPRDTKFKATTGTWRVQDHQRQDPFDRRPLSRVASETV